MITDLRHNMLLPIYCQTFESWVARLAGDKLALSPLAAEVANEVFFSVFGIPLLKM